MTGFAIRRAMLAIALLAAPPTGGGAAAEKATHLPGDFDFYVMAFSIAPSFCALDRNGRDRRQCRDPSDDAYRATPLTIHGLWPNRKGRGTGDQPQACSSERMRHLPAPLEARLARYMPGVADGLDAYQWRKHGVCTGLGPEAYFRHMIAFAEKADETIGAAIREKGFLGRNVAIDDLLAAIAERNPGLARAVVVGCRMAPMQPGDKGRTSRPQAYIREIRILVGKEISRDPDGDGWAGSFVPLSEAGFHASSGCPGRAGLLPAGFVR